MSVVAFECFAETVQITEIVCLSKEAGIAIIAALDNVLRHTR